jgi:hypothetical protein
MKFTALLLLLVPVAASAQYNYDYTSGPLFAATSNNLAVFPLPSLGSDITGIVTLSQELPENGTVTVSPLATTFQVGIVTIYNPSPNAGSSFTFTTHDGTLASFSFDQFNDPIENIQANSATQEVTYFDDYPVPPPGGAPGGVSQVTAVGPAGSFSGPGLSGPSLQRAPEIDPAGAGSALTLFVGILALVRGRRIRRSAPAAH